MHVECKPEDSGSSPGEDKHLSIKLLLLLLLLLLLSSFDFYPSPNIARMIKSRRLRWAGHVVRMDEGRSAFKILTGMSTGKRHLGRSRLRWITILKWILKT